MCHCLLMPWEEADLLEMSNLDLIAGTVVSARQKTNTPFSGDSVKKSNNQE